MKKIKCLFVLSRILGMNTHTNYIVKALASCPEIEPQVICFVHGDYTEYRSIKVYDFIGRRFESSRCVASKVASLVKHDYDCVFLNSMEFIVGMTERLSKTRTILAQDTTDVLSHDLIYRRSPGAMSRAKRAAKDAFSGVFYRRAYKFVDVFMPMTDWCANSLVADYGVPRERMVVSMAGLDLNLWQPSVSDRTRDMPRLLFVGNGFSYKGGHFLLECFRRRLSHACRLTLVCNDPQLSHMTLPAGVELRQGMGHERLPQLVDIFAQSDIFVMPTFLDKASWVNIEAAAMGLPVVSRDCGGISDLVVDGFNGRLMPYNSGLDAWADAILELVEDPAARARFGNNGRMMAQERFSEKRLVADLRRAFEMLGLPD